MLLGAVVDELSNGVGDRSAVRPGAGLQSPPVLLRSPARDAALVFTERAPVVLAYAAMRALGRVAEAIGVGLHGLPFGRFPPRYAGLSRLFRDAGVLDQAGRGAA